MGIEFLNLGNGDPRPQLREILLEQDTLRKASKLETTFPSPGDNTHPEQQLAKWLETGVPRGMYLSSWGALPPSLLE